MKSSRIVIYMTFVFLLVPLISCASQQTYKGKLIDAETLAPIKGALVIATWTKTRFGGLLVDTRFKDAKETLTDENGDWEITGIEGENSKTRWFFQYLGIFRIKDPTFRFYKPGYTEYVAYGNFLAYSVVDKENDLEGIILRRPGNTFEERKKYFDTYTMADPCIQVKDPEKRLRSLDFSFEYPEGVIQVGRTWCFNNNIKPYWVYTVVGLRKARTRQEEIHAMSRLSANERLLPLSVKMAREERKRLLGPEVLSKFL